LLEGAERIAAVGANRLQDVCDRQRQISLALLQQVVEHPQSIGVRQIVKDDGVVERLCGEVGIQPGL